MSLFSLGRVVSTPGAIEALGEAGVGALDLIARHAKGDWGEIDKDDVGLNEAALADGTRIVSIYRLTKRVTVWVITEADRSATTFLLPSEY